MVEEQLRHPRGDRRRPVRDERVLRAMEEVPREEFVPAGWQKSAFEDRALPIGPEQTISQPYMVGIMTELLGAEPGDVVLEVGTGSGYQAAVLASLVRKVWSVESVEHLAREAGQRLARLGFANVHVLHGDGRRGWPEHGPYDGIIVTAAGEGVPRALLEQLKPGGRMVIPLRVGGDQQELMVIERREDGGYEQKRIMPVRFVPLTDERE